MVLCVYKSSARRAVRTPMGGTAPWSSFTGPWRTAPSNPLVIPKGAWCARRRLRRSLRGAACQLPDPWRRTLLTLY